MRLGSTCLILIVAGVAVGGCFRENRGTLQQAEVAWLEFRGEVDGAEFSLVDENGGTIAEATAAEAATRYSVAPGTVILVVRRAGAEVVRRKLFLVAGQSREVWIP